MFGSNSIHASKNTKKNHTFTHVEIKSKSFLFRTPVGKDEIKRDNNAKMYWKHDPCAYFCPILSKNPWVHLNL